MNAAGEHAGNATQWQSIPSWGRSAIRLCSASPTSAKDFDRVEIYGKAEWFNPGGSVKDRPALRMIEEGERSGALTREKIILDSSSGNTGIAYAWIGAVKGYRVQLAVPRNVSQERQADVAGVRRRGDLYRPA